jgi:hemerythrin-like domain-containing protein
MTEANDQPPAGPPRGRFTIVYLIHEAFRRDLARLAGAVRAPRTGPPRARAFQAHWEFVDEQLHHHHAVEDDSLWPLVRPKLQGRDEALAVLDEMEADHRKLLPEGRAVSDEFESFAAQPDQAAGTALADHLDELATLLGAHLDSEESRCFPVIDEALTPEEFEAFGKATAKAVGMRGSARFFPWIFDSSDPVERTAVLSMPPPPVRLLCRYVWEPRYQRQVATLWADSGDRS